MAATVSEGLTMKKTIFLLLVLAWLPGNAQAGLSVFSCEPEWAALAAELGDDRLSIVSATTGQQDVHYIQARPSLIAQVRKADLVICTGADLEAGWLPMLLRQANNPGVLPGQPGFLAASEFVDLLEKPQVLDRAAGDIHPYGNPHIQMDPRNIGRVADELASRLQHLDAANAEAYQSRHADFRRRWDEAVDGWSRRLEPINGARFVTYHRSWVYLFHWAGLEEVGTLEPKPGIPPSSSYLAGLTARLEGQKVSGIVHAAYQSPRASRWLSDRTGIPVLLLPHTVGSTDSSVDLFSMFEQLVSLLEETRK